MRRGAVLGKLTPRFQAAFGTAQAVICGPMRWVRAGGLVRCGEASLLGAMEAVLRKELIGFEAGTRSFGPIVG